MVWAPIPGYEGLYEVSDQGVVRSRDRCVGARAGSFAVRRGRTLRPVCKGGRYLAVSLTREGGKRQVFVHDLVLLAFVGPKPKGLQACHHNDVKHDNTLGNLRYDTPKANVADAYRNGRRR